VKLIAWSELDDDERRIASAQMLVLLVCVSPLLGLLAALVGMLFGNRAFATAFAANPKGVLLGVAWVGLYLLAGILIGARRMIGGILGLALFAWALFESWPGAGPSLAGRRAGPSVEGGYGSHGLRRIARIAS
jgi:hypothetical protein